MKLIVGLGNIGKEYSQTRHNVGFMVADRIADKFCCAFGREERHATAAEFRIEGEKILILKPTTYMNNSGQAVGEYARFFNIAPEDIAVIHDDMDLELGVLRIRKNGSSGGHNGIKSIQSHLGTEAFPRFRIGIGHPLHQKEVVIDHVLTRFSEEEKKIIEPTIDNAAKAVEAWLTENMEAVMNKFNTKKAKKEKKPPVSGLCSYPPD